MTNIRRSARSQELSHLRVSISDLNVKNMRVSTIHGNAYSRLLEVQNKTNLCAGQKYSHTMLTYRHWKGDRKSPYKQGKSITKVMLWKSKRHLLLVQNTKEIQEDISIFKLNISNLNKAVISRTQFTETLKNRSSLYYLIKTVFCITHVMPK